jgi:hypothetical protein
MVFNADPDIAWHEPVLSEDDDLASRERSAANLATAVRADRAALLS